MNVKTLKVLDKELRYQKGWKNAYHAAQILRDEYKAEKVVLFGSLLDINKVTSHSDIDIAVWKLADDDYYQALSRLSELSLEFTFDLIQFESASNSLRNTILQCGDRLDDLDNNVLISELIVSNDIEVPMKEYSVLIGQIQQELIELEILVASNQRLIDKIKATNDQDYLGSIALNLHGFYSGVERIFKQIAQTVDNSVPDTPDWHRQLLRQMAANIPNIRPLVIGVKTRIILDEYCSFCQVVRNIYSMNLKLDRVQILAEEVMNCFAFLRQDLDVFLDEIS